MSEIELVSVNVGMPAFLGRHHGQEIVSGFRKSPIHSATMRVEEMNIVGDAQADLINHGGPDKAVYVYPAEHLVPWTTDLQPDLPFGPASFGENLTIRGVTETQVCIGDVWQVGDAVLQICQPRYPCFKLSMATGFPHVVKQMVQNGRTGWYLRVLTPGTAPATGAMTVLEHHPLQVTVADAHAARLPQAEQALIRKVAAVPELADSLRTALESELA